MKIPHAVLFSFLAVLFIMLISANDAAACYVDSGACPGYWEMHYSGSYVVPPPYGGTFTTVVDANFCVIDEIKSCGGPYTYCEYVQLRGCFQLSGGTGTINIDLGKPYAGWGFITVSGGNDNPSIQKVSSTEVQVTLQDPGCWLIVIDSQHFAPTSSPEPISVCINIDPGQYQNLESNTLTTC